VTTMPKPTFASVILVPVPSTTGTVISGSGHAESSAKAKSSNAGKPRPTNVKLVSVGKTPAKKAGSEKAEDLVVL
jgi:hypothetical protein